MSNERVSEESWFYMNGGHREGPVSDEVMMRLVRSGALGSKALTWRKGFSEWTKIEDTSLKDLLPMSQEVGRSVFHQKVNVKSLLAGLAALAVVAFLLKGWGFSGSIQLTSIGVARFQSCEYKGSFVGGRGYDCVIRNTSASDPRDVSETGCAGFDSEGRVIHGASSVLDLYRTVMGPGEERVVRVYVPEDAATAVCSENGDVPSMSQLKIVMADLEEHGLISKLEL